MNNFWQTIKKPILALAPMAGVTDIAFRQMCKRFGADIIFTEFASSDAIHFGSKKSFEMIKFNDKERPIVVQIFGKDPKMFASAGKKLEQLGFDGIDINFGCPAYKVVKHGGGVSLMKDPKQCAELVQALTEAVSIPVSIKIRASIKKDSNAKKIKRTNDKNPPEQSALQNMNTHNDPTDCGPSSDLDEVTALDLINEIKHLSVAAIMVHARSYERPFDGFPNVEIVKQMRQVWDRTLIFNGGVYTPEVAKEMIDATGADGVGIARGAWGSPWLFEQIRDYLKTGTYQTYSPEQIKSFILDHARLALEQKGEHGLVELRKHLSWYVKGWPGAKKIRDALVRTSTIEEIESILK